jgi:GT2 family glycosyltransferase
MLSATVIVPTYSRPEALARTLDALITMDFPPELYEIVVVDTGSGELRAEDVTRSDRIIYRRYPDLGVAAARNRGAALASGELLLFVDDDIVVGEGNLRQHEAHHRSTKRCLVSGHWEFDPALRTKLEQSALGRYRLDYEDRYNKPNAVGIGQDHGQVHTLTLAASNMSIRREVFLMLGGFDERFPVAAEDQDLTWRARGAGCTLIYDYDIGVIHNDQHRDFTTLCRRLERASVGTVYFAAKNRDAPRPTMLELNGPIRRHDSRRLVIRKLARSFLSHGFPLKLAHGIVRLAERTAPRGDRLLEWVYNAVGGLYVFRGVRLGLQLTSGESWPSAHQAMPDRRLTMRAARAREIRFLNRRRGSAAK